MTYCFGLVFLRVDFTENRKQICGEEILRHVDKRASQPDFDSIGPRGTGTGYRRRGQEGAARTGGSERY